MKVIQNFFLGDFVTNDPVEWGRDYSDDLDEGKSSESKEASKPKMSEAKKLHNDLIHRITEFYKKGNEWGLITNNKNEVKKLKSIASKLLGQKDKRKQRSQTKLKRTIVKT